MFINLRIFSQNKASILEFSKVLFRLLNKTNLNFSIKNVKRIDKKRLFVILKSPYGNKTAQEQFQSCTISNKKIFNTIQVLKLVVLIKEMQIQLFSDIQIKIIFITNNYELKKLKNKLINLRLYRLTKTRFQTNINASKLNKNLLYFKLFNLKGYHLA